MEKTIRSLMLLMVITGVIFTACGPDTQAPEDQEKVNEVEVEFGETVKIEDAEKSGTEAEVKGESKGETSDKVGGELTNKSAGGATDKSGAENTGKSGAEVAPKAGTGSGSTSGSGTDAAAQPVADPVKTETNTSAGEPTVTVTTKYADGTYTKTGSYQSPAGAESVTVTVTVKDDVLQSVSVSANAVNETSKQLQGLFIAGVNQLVVGKKLDEVAVSGNVNGSSLTGAGFNSAVASIRAGAIR